MKGKRIPLRAVAARPARVSQATPLISASSWAATAIASPAPRSSSTASNTSSPPTTAPTRCTAAKSASANTCGRCWARGGGKNTYVKLGHRSPAGINGFPGNLDVTALISVYENTLTLAYEATTDAPTPISFTWHPYFTLSGDPRAPHRRATLTMAASHYLPVNESRVPTGEIAPVAGTPFDFRKPRSAARAAALLASADRADQRLRPLLGARQERARRGRRAVFTPRAACACG